MRHKKRQEEVKALPPLSFERRPSLSKEYFMTLRWEVEPFWCRKKEPELRKAEEEEEDRMLQ